MADFVEDVKAQEVWGLRLLDVERLNAMFGLLERVGDNVELHNEVQCWIDDYLEMMRVRNSGVGVRHEVLSASVVPDFTVEREHVGRLGLIDAVAKEVYGDSVGELAGVVRESCYKADFKAWLEVRMEGWYIERFGYSDDDVEFLTRVREEVYGFEP
jgi:hypothetical protein